MTSSLEDAIEKLTLADEQPADNNNTESTPLTVEYVTIVLIL
jgi:hypothetical protein